MKCQFKREYISLCIGLVLCAKPTIAITQSVQLIWKTSEDPNISYYSIYRASHLDSSFKLIGTASHPDSTHIDSDIRLNAKYYYAATSVDIFNNESGFSNIVEIETTPTPVELSSFAAHTNGNDIVLEWSTETESNNFGFEIQRSQNEKSLFKKVGFVTGSGTTSIPSKYSFIDKDLSRNKYCYRLKQIDYNGDFEFSNIVEISIGPIEEFRLHQNYPNPFNQVTQISYSTPIDCHVDLRIYNINGKEVYRLINKFQKSNTYTISWDATDKKGNGLPTGTYFYILKAKNQSKTQRMTLIK